MARERTAQRTLQSVEAVRSIILHTRRLRRHINAWFANERVQAGKPLSADDLQLIREVISEANILAHAAGELLIPDEAT